jgi:hypothetical protein
MNYLVLIIGLLYLVLVTPISLAQTPPSAFDYERYDRAFKAVYDGDIEQVKRLLNNGFPLNKRDGSQRTTPCTSSPTSRTTKYSSCWSKPAVTSTRWNTCAMMSSPSLRSPMMSSY